MNGLPHPPKLLHAWTIPCEKDLVAVWILSTYQQMYAAHKHLVKSQITLPVRRDYKAIFVPWEFRCRKTKKHGVGIIILNARELGLDVISHECLHASLEWLRVGSHRLRGSQLFVREENEATEERLACVHGNLLARLIRALRRAGYDPK